MVSPIRIERLKAFAFFNKRSKFLLNFFYFMGIRLIIIFDTLKVALLSTKLPGLIRTLSTKSTTRIAAGGKKWISATIGIVYPL